MNRKFSLVAMFFLVLFVVFVPKAFSQSVVNPGNGVWANRQILVLDLPGGMNAYYSLSGNDPESYGFAYDGPVLLDVEGDVYLRVVFVSADGKKLNENIFYTVKNAPLPKDSAAYDFIENVVANGLVDYTAGTNFSIPSSLEYSFGNGDESFQPGTSLFLPADSVVQRTVSCTVSDGTSFWKFAVRINPSLSGIFSRKDVPFTIEDWKTVRFTDMNLIYRIDDKWWEQPKIPLTLDRSVSHMISWQSVDYSSENPVKFFVLPPKPKINVETEPNGVKYIRSQGDSGYKFGIVDGDGDISGLYDSVRFDTFQGDLFSGSVRTGVYYDSVYQGEIGIDFRVNKRLPSKPVISSSAEGGWARKAVTLDIKKSSELELFVCVQGPLIVEEGWKNGDVMFSFIEEEFKKLNSGKILLSPSIDGAVAYKVSAYAMDSNGNKSGTSEYSVVIDSCNYYVDMETGMRLSVPADGTSERPFGTFSELLSHIDGSGFVRINLKGMMEMPCEKFELTSNMEILGSDDARIFFPENASLVVRDASLAISDCLITYAEKSSSDETVFSENHSLFSLERGVLIFDSVDLSAIFGKNGVIVDSSSSVVTIKDSGITGSANNYSACVAAVDSKISVKNSKITTVASTGVSFTCQGGLFELRKSRCSVIGVMGRIAELFNTHSSITDNEFSAQLKKTMGNGKAIYMDAKNLSVEDFSNSSSGF